MKGFFFFFLSFCSGILAVSVSAENVQTPAAVGGEKSEDLVLLEIDLKGPSKRSPVSATAVYGASPSQYVIRHGDESQEVCKRDLKKRKSRTSA